MVSALTFNRGCFLSPLFAKSCSFSILADRAVSLLPILLIKWVSMFTVRLEGIPRRCRSRIDQCVLCRRDHSQMRRLNTMTILANMVNHHTVRYFAYIDKIRYTMRPTIFFPKVKRAVSVFIKRPLPQITSVFTVIRSPFTVEPRYFFGCSIHTPIVPYITLRSKG